MSDEMSHATSDEMSHRVTVRWPTDDETSPEAGPAVARDEDRYVEAGPMAGPTAGSEARPRSRSEAGPTAGSNAGPRSRSEAGTGAGPNARTEAGRKAGTGAGPRSGSKAGRGAEPKAGPKRGPGAGRKAEMGDETETGDGPFGIIDQGEEIIVEIEEGRRLPAGGTDLYGSLARLTERAEKGADGQARTELVRAFATDAELWRSFGDMAERAERALREMMTRGDPAKGVEFDRSTAAMRQALLGTDPSPLERLLVERVVLCWIQVSHTDYIDALNLQERLGTPAGDAIERRQDRAHRRFLAAAKTLAQVRRLGVPMVQMNIGQNQVNIVSGSGEEGLPDDG